MTIPILCHNWCILYRQVNSEERYFDFHNIFCHIDVFECLNSNLMRILQMSKFDFAFKLELRAAHFIFIVDRLSRLKEISAKSAYLCQEIIDCNFASSSWLYFWWILECLIIETRYIMKVKTKRVYIITFNNERTFTFTFWLAPSHLALTLGRYYFDSWYIWLLWTMLFMQRLNNNCVLSSKSMYVSYWAFFTKKKLAMTFR